LTSPKLWRRRENFQNSGPSYDDFQGIFKKLEIGALYPALIRSRMRMWLETHWSAEEENRREQSMAAVHRWTICETPSCAHYSKPRPDACAKWGTRSSWWSTGWSIFKPWWWSRSRELRWHHTRHRWRSDFRVYTQFFVYNSRQKSARWPMNVRESLFSHSRTKRYAETLLTERFVT